MPSVASFRWAVKVLPFDSNLDRREHARLQKDTAISISCFFNLMKHTEPPKTSTKSCLFPYLVFI